MLNKKIAGLIVSGVILLPIAGFMHNKVEEGKGKLNIVKEEKFVKPKVSTESNRVELEKVQEKSTQETKSVIEEVQRDSKVPIQEEIVTKVEPKKVETEVKKETIEKKKVSEIKKDVVVQKEEAKKQQPIQKSIEKKKVEKPKVTGTSNATIQELIFQKVNEERKKAGVTPLTYNKTMERFAIKKSKDMGDKNYFAHEDLNGKLESYYIKQAGIRFNAWGENIGYLQGYSGASNVANTLMKNWMNSPGHRKNILSPNFKSIGVGVYKIGDKYYGTQEFFR